MDISPETKRAIEAIVLVSDAPVEPSLLAQLLEIPKAAVEAACAELAAGYEAEERGFVLARVAGGYRYQTHPDMAPFIERYVLEGQSGRLSAAALETLAIVAYKQPISRMQIAAIRGVNVDGVMRTLQQRGYIDDVARDPGPGNAVLFGTTALFLERLGLDTVDELPPLAAFVPGADVVEQLEETLRPERPDAAVPADAPAVDPAVHAAEVPARQAPDETGPDHGPPLPAVESAGPPDEAADLAASENSDDAADDGADWISVPTEVLGARPHAAPAASSDHARPIDLTEPTEPTETADDVRDGGLASDGEVGGDGGLARDGEDGGAVIDLASARPGVDDGNVRRHPASGTWSTPGVSSVRPADPPRGADAPIAKLIEPVIEIVRPVAAQPPAELPVADPGPPPEPFRSTPGHLGAGETETAAQHSPAHDPHPPRGAPDGPAGPAHD